MPKRDAIVVEGVVTEALPNAMFRVSLDGGRMVLAHLSGKVRLNFVRVVPGDRVQVELPPFVRGQNTLSRLNTEKFLIKEIGFTDMNRTAK